MKIAFMLALHNNPEQANVFIRQCLCCPDGEVFIHIDQKGLWIKNELIEDERVHILPHSYSVSWGNYTQVEYVLYLMRYIKEFGDFDWYSIHSGNDLMVRPCNELLDFLNRTDRYAFLDCHRLPWKDWQYGGGLGRIALIWPDCMRKRLKPHSVLRYARAIYGRMYGAKLIRGRKLPQDIIFYGKSAWYTLSSECVSDVLSYVDAHPDFLGLFEKSLCCDEIFFNTVVHLTAAKKGRDVESHNNLRFVDFDMADRKNVGSPKTLTIDDVDKISKSGAFFARKVDQNVDKRIIDYFYMT